MGEEETNEPGLFGVEWPEAYLGQFCKSGLAFKNERRNHPGTFNAKCTEVVEISFDDEEL